MYSSLHIDRPGPPKFPQLSTPSSLVSDLVDSVNNMAQLKMSPEFVRGSYCEIGHFVC